MNNSRKNKKCKKIKNNSIEKNSLNQQERGNMANKLFGTDGIRGQANSDRLSVQKVLKLAQAVGVVFKKTKPVPDGVLKQNNSFSQDMDQKRPVVVVGKDTRISGDMLEAALCAGLNSIGYDVYKIGVMPTPAVSSSVPYFKAAFGVMISASHNPYADNGIKLFGPDSFKMTDEMISQVEELFFQESLDAYLAGPDEIGRIFEKDYSEEYIRRLIHSLGEGASFKGIKAAVDCANGAQSDLAEKVFRRLGAEVFVVNNRPTGININEQCGATHPESISKAVTELGVDVGLAFDGDADRLIMADETGKVADGDQLIGALALEMQKSGQLSSTSVVATVMSNLGLEEELKKHGLFLQRTQVGERYVVEKMRQIKAQVGGESSGHLVLLDYTSSGDGLLAALHICKAIVDLGKKASQVMHCFQPFPQVMKNVRAKDKEEVKKILQSQKVKEALQTAQEALDKKGRLIIRESGTEPIIRIMVEAEDAELVESQSSFLFDVMSGELS